MAECAVCELPTCACSYSNNIEATPITVEDNALTRTAHRLGYEKGVMAGMESERVRVILFLRDSGKRFDDAMNGRGTEGDALRGASILIERGNHWAGRNE